MQKTPLNLRLQTNKIKPIMKKLIITGCISTIICTLIACEKTALPVKQGDYTNSAKQNSQQDAQKITTSGSSVWISQLAANNRITSYLNSIDTMTNPQLKSLLIDAQALRNYLANTDIVQIKLSIAHTQTIYATQPNTFQNINQNGISLIASGVDELGNYVYYDDIYVMNEMIPCPNNCIGTGTASNDIFITDNE